MKAANLSDMKDVPVMYDASIKGHSMRTVDIPSIYRLALPKDSHNFIRDKGSHVVLEMGPPLEVFDGKVCEIDWDLATRLQHYEFAERSVVEASVKGDDGAVQVIQAMVNVALQDPNSV